MQKIEVTITTPSPAMFVDGLSDVQCNDALNDGIYSAEPFTPRNKKPPHATGNPIPEVRKLENGDYCVMLEPVELVWYLSWRLRFPSLSEAEALEIWRKGTRDDGAFFNKNGSNSKRSFLLKTNPTNEPMRSEGVVCPGGNKFLAVDGKIVRKNNRDCVAIWVLDWHYLKTLSNAEARDLAIRLPNWLSHVAKIVHSDGRVTNWDYDFRILLMTSDEDEITKVVKGFPCRRNYIRASRVNLSEARLLHI